MAIIELNAEQTKSISESTEAIYVKDQTGRCFGPLNEIEGTQCFTAEQIMNALIASKSPNTKYYPLHEIIGALEESERTGDSSFINKLLKNPLKVNNFRPLSRDEAHER